MQYRDLQRLIVSIYLQCGENCQWKEASFYTALRCTVLYCIALSYTVWILHCTATHFTSVMCVTAPHLNSVNWSFCEECVMRPVAESLSECLWVCVRMAGNATAMTDTLLCPTLERCGLSALSLPNGVKLDYVNWAEGGMQRLDTNSILPL